MSPTRDVDRFIVTLREAETDTHMERTIVNTLYETRFSRTWSTDSLIVDGDKGRELSRELAAVFTNTQALQPFSTLLRIMNNLTTRLVFD